MKCLRNQALLGTQELGIQLGTQETMFLKCSINSGLFDCSCLKPFTKEEQSHFPKI